MYNRLINLFTAIHPSLLPFSRVHPSLPPFTPFHPSLPIVLGGLSEKT